MHWGIWFRCSHSVDSYTRKALKIFATRALGHPETRRFQEQTAVVLLEWCSDCDCCQIVEMVLPIAEGATRTA
jgi:hypothetical protein